MSSPGSTSGCKLWGSACDSNTLASGTYCVHGDCYADADAPTPKCICDPGYGGDRCDQAFEWVEFTSGGLISYDIASTFLPMWATDVGVLFLLGSSTGGSGKLGYGISSDGQNYVGTAVRNYIAQAEFDATGNNNNFRSSAAIGMPFEISLPQVSLKSNASYWLMFSRNPTRATLSIDDLYYTSILLDLIENPSIVHIRRAILGARDEQGGSSLGNGFQGCIGTFRLGHHNLPLLADDNTSGNSVISKRQSQKATSGNITITNSKGVARGCSQRVTCATFDSSYCPSNMVCIDFWKGPFCTCPAGMHAVLGPDGTVSMCFDSIFSEASPIQDFDHGNPERASRPSSQQSIDRDNSYKKNESCDSERIATEFSERMLNLSEKFERMLDFNFEEKKKIQAKIEEKDEYIKKLEKRINDLTYVDNYSQFTDNIIPIVLLIFITVGTIVFVTYIFNLINYAHKYLNQEYTCTRLDLVFRRELIHRESHLTQTPMNNSNLPQMENQAKPNDEVSKSGKEHSNRATNEYQEPISHSTGESVSSV